MASTSDIARRYFTALAAHDLDEATGCWKPGAIDRKVGPRVPHPAFDADVAQAAEAP